jgi:DNA-binding transcriptional MerR regulator/effector-binding domain-containing protein
VDALVTIGEFSKMTYLSVKALRHYHDIGLLEPADIDRDSGYRRYSTEQVATAQAIRRFRDLDMPIEQVRAVLSAPDVEARNQAILVHLEHMQEQLRRTETTVASLQALLAAGAPVGVVEDRSLPALWSLAISDEVAFDAAGEWCEQVFAELHAVLSTVGVEPTGPDGALYHDDFFEEGQGRVVAFVPVVDEVVDGGRATMLALDESSVAVMVHDGPFADLDQTYGALGSVVAARGDGRPGPIREHYLDDDHTEVCWPIVDRRG